MIWLFAKVFVVGGLICVVGQIIMDLTNITPARVLVLFVTSGVILSGLGIYKPIVDFAQAGATVPLTGFGYVLAKGSMEAVDKNGLLGIFTGGLTATSAGIAAAIIFGYINALLFNSKSKN